MSGRWAGAHAKITMPIHTLESPPRLYDAALLKRNAGNAVPQSLHAHLARLVMATVVMARSPRRVQGSLLAPTINAPTIGDPHG